MYNNIIVNLAHPPHKNRAYVLFHETLFHLIMKVKMYFFCNIERGNVRRGDLAHTITVDLTMPLYANILLGHPTLG